MLYNDKAHDKVTQVQASLGRNKVVNLGKMTITENHQTELFALRDNSASSRPIPTFSRSNAPVFNPVENDNERRDEGFGYSDRSRTNSSDSHPTNSSGPLPALDIDFVETTYYRRDFRFTPSLSPSCYSYTHKHPHPTLTAGDEYPTETPRENMAPRIRVSLNKQCFVPGEILNGTVFLDLPKELQGIKPANESSQKSTTPSGTTPASAVESGPDFPVKVLVSFYGVEQVSFIGGTGDVVTKHHDCLTETKELVEFPGSIPEGVHEFQFGFNVPVSAPPSCSVSFNNEGTGNIIYAVVVSVEGVAAAESLVCSSPVIIRELPHSNSSPTLNNRNSGVSTRTDITAPSAISRGNSTLSSTSRSRKSKSRKAIMRKIFPIGRSHIRAQLQEETVPFSGRIRINFEEDDLKRSKKKKATVKLIQKVELKGDGDDVQHFDSILYVAEFEMGAIKTIELLLPIESNDLSPSVESQLVRCQYEIQIKTKSTLKIFRRPVSLCLPLKLVSGDHS